MLNIRPITQKDKEIFLILSAEFYNSPAVLSPIKAEYHENAFNELMRSRDYLDCFIHIDIYITDIYVCLSKNITIHTENKSISHSVMSSSL